MPTTANPKKRKAQRMKSEFNWKRALSVAAVWLAVFAGWEAAYRIFGWKPYVFPAPSHVLDAVAGLVGAKTYFGDALSGADGPWPFHGQGLVFEGAVWQCQLFTALGVSLLRLLIGFALSIGLGLAIGLFMFRFKFIDALLGPLFLGLQTLPSVCWVPLAVLSIGINETGILFVAVMGSFFAFAITLRDGLRTTPTIYRSAGLVFGAHRLRFYSQVMLPAGLPALAGALRSGFSFAWRSLMGGELIFALKRHGVGHLLATGREYGDVAQVVASMILMVLIGMTADRLLFAPVERRVRARFGLG